MPGETPCQKCKSPWVVSRYIITCGFEYLRHRCQSCGYMWDESKKDAKERRP